MPVLLVSIVHVIPGAEAAFEALARRTAEASHAEPGSIVYALHVSERDPTEFVFIEKWVDRAALRAHSRTPHMTEFAAEIENLLVTPPTFSIVNSIPVGNAAKGSI